MEIKKKRREFASIMFTNIPIYETVVMWRSTESTV